MYREAVATANVCWAGCRNTRRVPLLRQIDVDRARIGEAAHTAKRAEMMIERSVLLHQDDDVLDILMVPVRWLAGIASALAMFAVQLQRPTLRPINCRN